MLCAPARLFKVQSAPPRLRDFLARIAEVCDGIAERFRQAGEIGGSDGLQRNRRFPLHLSIAGAGKKPGPVRPLDAHRKGTGAHERTELAGIVWGAVTQTVAEPNLLVRVNLDFELGAVEGGVKCAVQHAGERPGGAVAREGAIHGPAIAEEKRIGRFQQEGIHGVEGAG